MKDFDLVVIGAGAAGLSTAYVSVDFLPAVKRLVNG